MRGSNFIMGSGAVLAIYGAINTVFVIMIFLSANANNPEILAFNQSGLFMVVYGLVQGLIPMVAGGLGFIWRNKEDKTKYVLWCSYVLIANFYFLFCTSYGLDIGVILFDAMWLFAALCFFYGARKNYDEMEEVNRRIEANRKGESGS